MWLKGLDFCFRDKEEAGQIDMTFPECIYLYLAYKECIITHRCSRVQQYLTPVTSKTTVLHYLMFKNSSNPYSDNKGAALFGLKC
jgi:hypothetical protein